MRRIPMKEVYRTALRCLISYDNKPGHYAELAGADLDKRTQKDINDCKKERDLYKIEYFDNKETSTHFNKLISKTNPGEVYYVFRGSDELYDWIKNFSAFKLKVDEEMSKKGDDIGIVDITNRTSQEALKERYEAFARENFGNAFNFLRQTKLCNSFRDLPSDVSESIDVMFTAAKTNLKYFNEYKKKIYMHLGFVMQYNSISKVFDKEFAEIEKNIDKYTKITIEGHSLGSSIARIAYLTQVIKRPKIWDKVYLTVLGTPRLGNKYFEKMLSLIGKDKYAIYNVKKDLVCQLPLKSMGYSDPIEWHFIEPKIGVPYNNKGNHTLYYYIHSIREYM